MASHFFGLLTPEDIENRSKIDAFMSRRYGWNRPDIGHEKEKKMADNIEISIVLFEMKRVDHSEYLPSPRVDESKKKKNEAA